MANIRSYPFVLLMAAASCWCEGCRNSSFEDKEQIELDADSFGLAYFNWRYGDAANRVTPESRKWIRFAASNVTQEDVDTLNTFEFGATSIVDKISYENDTSAIITYYVENYLLPRNIGKQNEVLNDATVKVRMVCRGNRWLAAFENGLPNPEVE